MLFKLGAGDSNLEVNSAVCPFLLIDGGSKYQLMLNQKHLKGHGQDLGKKLFLRF